MTRTVALSLLLLSSFLQWRMLATAQTADPETQRVVTTTRLAALFSKLEQQWNQAIQQKEDKAALERILSEEFEQWTPAPPGAPLLREEWLHNIT